MITFQFSTLAGENVEITNAVLYPNSVKSIDIERRQLNGDRDWYKGSFIDLSFMVYLSSFSDPQAEFERLKQYEWQKGNLVFSGSVFPTISSTGGQLKYLLRSVRTKPHRPTSGRDIMVLSFICLEITSEEAQYIIDNLNNFIWTNNNQKVEVGKG